MNKLIKYLLKENYLNIICITFFSLAYLLVFATNIQTEGEINIDTSIFSYICFVYALLSFSLISFKMKKISIDKYYALPIKKNKLYLSYYIVSLIRIALPLLISFIAYLIIIITKTHTVNGLYLILFFLYELIMVIAIHTILMYVYYLQNNHNDGHVNASLVIFLPFLIATAVLSIIDLSNGVYLSNFLNAFNYTLLSPLFTSQFEELINTGSINVFHLNHFFFALGIILVAIGCVILFAFTSKNEKPENCLNKSESWLGYKTLIPITSLCLTSLTPGPYVIFTVLFTFILYVSYQKGIRFDKKVKLVFALLSLIEVAYSISINMMFDIF